MRKYLVIIGIVAITIFCNNVFAAGDKTITSQKYVENQVATKQDKIPAIDTNTVITHTGTTGDIGEKGIYDSGENYASQQTALMTAGDANTGINNALENEFICIEEDTDGTCLIWKIKNSTESSASRNLFDIYNSVRYKSSWSSTGYWKPVNESNVAQTWGIAVEPNTTYTISKNGGNRLCVTGFRTVKVPGTENLVPDFLIRTSIDDIYGEFSYTFTTPSNCVWILFETKNNNSGIQDAINVQLEKGAVATEYEPYQNLYIPQNQ